MTNNEKTTRRIPTPRKPLSQRRHSVTVSMPACFHVELEELYTRHGDGDSFSAFMVKALRSGIKALRLK